MSCVPDYKKATNAAYQLLLSMRIFSLATNVFSIVEEYLENCKLLTYGQACFLYGYTIDSLLAVSEFGFSIIDQSNKRRIILYNESKPLTSIRFTIAHEIGHVVLKHMDEFCAWSEKEANCFARNVLCPISTIIGLGLDSVEDYTSIFNVSTQMATISFDKRGVDTHYIEDDLFSSLSAKLYFYLNGYGDTEHSNAMVS